MSTRLSVNINDETAAALRDLAARHDNTVTETVRRAVSVYRYLQIEQDSGQRIRLVDDQGYVENVRLLG